MHMQHTQMRVLNALFMPLFSCGFFFTLRCSAEGDRFLCANTCVGVRYVLNVHGEFADRVCMSKDRGDFIKSEITNRANFIDDIIPFDFNVTVPRHSVAGCEHRNKIRRHAVWDKTAPDSSIQVALIISNELPVGSIQIAAAGANEYAEFFNSENSTFFRRILDEGVVEVTATIITPTANATTNETVVHDILDMLNGYHSTTALSTDAVDTTSNVDTTSSVLTSSANGLTTSAVVGTASVTTTPMINKTSDNRIINDKFIGDDLAKEFEPGKSGATVLAINLLLLFCAVMLVMQI